MLTICILFTTLTTKSNGVWEGASYQTPDLRILTRPPVLKFLDPPLDPFIKLGFKYTQRQECFLLFSTRLNANFSNSFYPFAYLIIPKFTDPDYNFGRGCNM